ncbi:cation:proton antiporter [Litorimonas haliclonae]|uniref:cation:proton antiporter n=1 Tax=Litorimonas haliclonae TaxID=2081977 RepID=UPI0039F1046F
MADFIMQNQIAFYYSLIGAAFMGLTFQPAFRDKMLFNIPIIYILVGIIGALIGLPVINPMGTETEAKIVEHASELIVIISLAGAGLSIDLKARWRTWQPTWRLLAIAMPLTILCVVWLGVNLAGLSVAGAILLAGALAPTDPVLARSVSVGSPHSEQNGTRTALTSEAGLNDGLAFPFIWLAVGVALATGDFSWGSWVLEDVLYRTTAGVIAGLAVGWCLTKILFSSIGDATNNRSNAALVLLAATFLSYGLAELVHGYGFLSVFISARAARAFTKDTKAEPYENKAHKSADQLEAILLAVILLWFGTFIGGSLWHVWTWQDFAIAMAVVFVIRPIAAWISLLGHDMEKVDRAKIAFFGIRGMGSIFYAAFGLNQVEFADPERIWCVISFTILISALVHGSLANRWMADAGVDEPDDTEQRNANTNDKKTA